MVKKRSGKGGTYKATSRGMRQLMRYDPAVTQMVRSAAQRLAYEANGFEDRGYFFRVVGYVQAVSFHAFVFPYGAHATRAQAKYDLLQRALWSAIPDMTLGVTNSANRGGGSPSI